MLDRALSWGKPKNILNLFIASAAALACLAPRPALAAEDPSGFFGVSGGLAVPSLSNTSARPQWGFSAGAKLGSEFGLSGYYLTSTKDESINGASSTFAFDLYGVQASYHFEGEARGAFFGARLGMSKVTETVAGASVSTSPYHFGVAGGYDHFFNDVFSLGGEASFISVGQADAAGTGSLKTDAFNVLSFLLAAKLWF
jgi:hypothetical protein